MAYRNAERFTLAFRTCAFIGIVTSCQIVLMLGSGVLRSYITVVAEVGVAALFGVIAAVLRFTAFGKNNVESILAGVCTTALMTIPLAFTPVNLRRVQSLLDACMQANSTDPHRALAVPANSTSLFYGVYGVNDFGCRSFAESASGSPAFFLMSLLAQV